MTEKRLYVYGLVGPDAHVPQRAKPVEPSGGNVSMTSYEGIGALVSEIEEGSVRPTKANLDSHQMVVEEASLRDTVIPMRFGVVVESEEELVNGFLRREREKLTRLLREYEARVEMRVEAQYQENVALSEVAEADPRVRRLTQKLRGRPIEATYYDRIALGELVAADMQRRAESDARRIGGKLAAAAERARRLSASNENTVFRGAFLVHKTRLNDFDRELTTLADREAHRMSFQAVGPLAPWDFADLDMSQPESREDRPNRRPMVSWAS